MLLLACTFRNKVLQSSSGSVHSLSLIVFKHRAHYPVLSSSSLISKAELQEWEQPLTQPFNTHATVPPMVTRDDGPHRTWLSSLTVLRKTLRPSDTHVFFSFRLCETVVPLEDPIITETTSTLQEWGVLWKQLFVVSSVTAHILFMKPSTLQ